MGRPRGSGVILVEERLWRKVDIKTPDECWEWQGPKDRKGYGIRMAAYRNEDTDKWVHKAPTHVVMYDLTGEWPTEWVLHKCNNPPCCNPRHLYLGNQSDNERDKVEAGTNSTLLYGWDHVFGHRQYKK